MFWQILFVAEFWGARCKVLCPVLPLEEGPGDLREAPANLQHHPATEPHALPSPRGYASRRQPDNAVSQGIRKHGVVSLHHHDSHPIVFGLRKGNAAIGQPGSKALSEH